jgi:hypothetical protein
MQPLLRRLALRSLSDLLPTFIVATLVPEDSGRVEGRLLLRETGVGTGWSSATGQTGLSEVAPSTAEATL